MEDGIKFKKGQTGIYLSPTAKRLLAKTAGAMGLTMSMLVELALREYSFHHREEIEFNWNLTSDKRPRF